MRRRRGLVWLTGILMIAVFSLSSLAGWMVWQRQAASGEREDIRALGQKTEGGESRLAKDSFQESEIGQAGAGNPAVQQGQGMSGMPGEDGGAEGGIQPDAALEPQLQPNSGVQPDSQLQPDSGVQPDSQLRPNSETQTASQPQQDITLLFAGDVYLSNYVLNAYDQAGGIQGVLDEGIRQEIRQADIFMVNQEFPFADRGTAAEDKQFTFRLPPERVSILQEMEADIVTLANNHILDFGQEGLLDSCQTLDEAGILYVGGGQDLNRARELKTIQAGDKTIGFLGTCRVYMDASWAAGPSHPGVFSTYDPAQAIESIREARKQCDYLAVYVHWGVERETEPKEYQKAMGRQYIDAGADLVVGSHPHVLQNIEYYNGKPIVYSLGNFVFGSSIPQTALLKIVLKPDYWLSRQEEQSRISTPDGMENHAELTLIPCTSSNGYTRLSPP